MNSYLDPRAASRYEEAVGQFDCRLEFRESAEPLLTYPLPTTLDALQRKLDAVFRGLLEGHHPRAIDAGVRFAFADETTLVAAAPINGSRRFSDRYRFVPASGSREQRRACDMLADGLDLAERVWLDHKRSVWHACRRVERTASQLLLMHLLRCRSLAAEAEQRYVRNRDWDPKDITHYTDDFLSLERALVKLAKAREEADLDALRKNKSVRQAAALAAMALSMTALEGVPSLKDAFKGVEDTAGKAAADASRSSVVYLATMRELAATHPILTTLQHYTEGMRSKGKTKNYPSASFQRDVRDAITNARNAIDRLRKIANTPIIPTLIDAEKDADGRVEPPSIKSTIEAVRKAELTTVWKLPFFLDRALEFLLVEERRRVLAIKRHAEEQAKEQAFAETFATLGCEAVATFAPLAGPVGIGIAVAWAVYGSAQSMHEYREVQTLYDATLDPAALLRGDEEHDPGDPSAVIMDLVGMLTAPF